MPRLVQALGEEPTPMRRPTRHGRHAQLLQLLSPSHMYTHIYTQLLQLLSPSHMYTHIYTHMYAHIYTHICTHMYAHIYTHLLRLLNGFVEVLCGLDKDEDE